MTHTIHNLQELESKILSGISSDELMRNTEAIAQWERYSATPEEWEAADYVRDTLDSYGVSTRMHEAELLISLPKSAVVTVTSPQAQRF